MFSRLNTKPSAFTLLETLIVVAIMAAAVGFSVLYAQTDDMRTDLRTQAAIFTSYLRETQTNASSGKGNSAAGIHLESDRYVLFYGAVYNSNDSKNFVVMLPATVRITNISFAGGGADIIFTTPLGETTQTGSMDFDSGKLGQSVHITINALGSANYE